MRILLWHGYLLGGTGSNVYTRALAREWSRAGHDVVVVCQEPHPERYDLGGARVFRPNVGGLLPVFVARPLRGHRGEARCTEFTREERDRYVALNATASVRSGCRRPRFRQPRPARRALLVLRAARRSWSRRTAPSSSTRCGATTSLIAWGQQTLRGCRSGVRRLRAHPGRARGSRRSRRPRARGAAGRRRRRVPARARVTRRSPRLLAEAQRGSCRTRGTRTSASRTTGNAARFAEFFDGRPADRRLLRQADPQQGRPRSARGAAKRRRPGGDRRLRRLPRGARAHRAAAARSSRARSSTATSSSCCRWPTSPSCRRSSPRLSGWSPSRPQLPGRRRSSLVTRASPRSRRGSRPSIRPSSRHLVELRDGRRADLAAKLAELLALSPEARAGLGEAARRAVLSSAGAGRASAGGCRITSFRLVRWATRSARARTSRCARPARLSKTDRTSRSRWRRSSRCSIPKRSS